MILESSITLLEHHNKWNPSNRTELATLNLRQTTFCDNFRLRPRSNDDDSGGGERFERNRNRNRNRKRSILVVKPFYFHDLKAVVNPFIVESLLTIVRKYAVPA
jgi:hypothetical protein